MLISASRRTDVPAFYSEWFMNRIREGYACVQNPFNPSRHSEVDLSPHAVDAVVFWTKDPSPLIPHLDELDARGYNYCFLFTITGHPPAVEPCVPPLEQSIRIFRDLSDRTSPERVVWRFDPILVSSVTPEEEVTGRFDKIAGLLAGHTKRVIISFTHFYRKTVAGLNRLARDTGIVFMDVSDDLHRMRGMAAALSASARRHGLEILGCAGKQDLSDRGIPPGKCIDAGLMERAFGINLALGKDPSQRGNCGCVESRDIGQYNTCAHGCVYCYANASPSLARENLARHDPRSPFLLEGGDRGKQPSLSHPLQGRL